MRARGRMGEEAMHLFIAVPTQPPVAHWSPAEKEGSTPETGIWFRRRQKMVSTVFRVELAAPEHKRGSIHVRAGELHDLGPLLGVGRDRSAVALRRAGQGD